MPHLFTSPFYISAAETGQVSSDIFPQHREPGLVGVEEERVSREKQSTNQSMSFLKYNRVCALFVECRQRKKKRGRTDHSWAYVCQTALSRLGLVRGRGVRQVESHSESTVCHISAWCTATLRSTCSTRCLWETLWAFLLKPPWSSSGVDKELAAKESMEGADGLPLQWLALDFRGTELDDGWEKMQCLLLVAARVTPRQSEADAR